MKIFKILSQSFLRKELLGKRGLKFLILTGLTSVSLSACNKADYLDIDAGARPALSAKVKFVNARVSPGAVQFWDFTRQVTSTAIIRNGSTPGYLDTQYGKVQYNVTEGTGTTYKASYLFGGSSIFVQETDKASFAGPNGPIASYYHTLFVVPKLKSSKLNPGNTDSLVFVYDDLSVPATGKAKIRFANFSPDAPKLNFTYEGGTPVFTGVGYGSFGDQTIITYDANGKAPANIPGLSWKTLGPFKEIPAGTGLNFELRNAQTNALITLPNNSLSNINLEAGKIYTIFISGAQSGNALFSATVIKHTKEDQSSQ
ncbi:protein of unknown function [Pseudarcicella hirudinis]|uniref:DUF4397 domain-containing protein n=1 Tax=Pseudarcicella hirudinis TaxID=1079859 RepID=A0A1I5RIE4_9BACT|nr:DUF4397 domain-containing protein [Pseudarcicella hirudinis]SFP58334.1 protein of unknown function [Pseudarcicella hirudinis]